MPALRPIPWDIYEEHLDEAAFLWGMWEHALDAANYSLDEVIDGPEERLLAHLDGLVLGGARVAEKLLVPALGDDDPGKVAAATWVLLQAEDADHLDLVLEALGKAESKEARAMMGRAFELAGRSDFGARLLPRLEASAPAVQAVIVGAVSAEQARRPATAGGNATVRLPLGSLLETRNPELLLACLRAVRRAPDPELAPLCEKAFASAYVAVRDAAIEAGVVLGMPAARMACNKLVARNAPGCRLPMAVLALGGEPVDLKTVLKRLEVETMRRDALWALGFSGTGEAAEAALALLEDEELAQLAGEVFGTITGAVIAGPLAKIGETDNSSPPEADEDDDAPPPALKPEDDLRAPHPENLRKWWEKLKSAGFDAASGRRYLGARSLNGEAMKAAIELGPTWRRRVWLMELSRYNASGFDWTTWARAQKPAATTLPTEAPRGRR